MKVLDEKLFNHFHDSKLWQSKAKMFGLRIMMARRMAELKSEEVAHWIGVSPAKLSRFENGRYTPDMVELSKIAEITEKDIEYFFKD